MALSNGTNRVGRPGKGDRVVRTTRLPVTTSALLERAADRDGLSLSEYIANLVQDHFGLDPVALPRPDNEEPQRLAV